MKRIVLLILLMIVAACGGAETMADDNVAEEQATAPSTDTSAGEAAAAEPTAESEPDASKPTTPPENNPTIAPVATPTDEATAEPEPEEISVEPDEAVEADPIGELTFIADDGLPLIGTFQQGGGELPRPTILLLHMLSSNRHVWEQFAGQLNEAGYNTLALDMRGHGDSGAVRDWELARSDLQLVLDSLAARPDVDASRMAIVGGSIGSNMALVAGAAEPTIKTVVLLSPGLDYRGVETPPAMEGMGDRPVLIVASSEDVYSADSSRTLFELARSDQSQLEIYDLAGHGTNMFNKEASLSGLILTWLDQYLGE